MFRVYQVMEDDTLDNIASKFDTTFDKIKEINGIDFINAGDIIVVPNNNWYNKYIVKNGDNLYQIAIKNNINLDSLIKINGLNKDDYIYPGEEIIIPKDEYMIYVTKNGDTLKDILDMLDGKKIYNQGSNVSMMEDQLIVYKK